LFVAKAHGAPIKAIGEPMKKPKTKMRTTMFILGLSLLATSVICSPSQAVLIELEPVMLQIGTNVSNLFEGVMICG